MTKKSVALSVCLVAMLLVAYLLPDCARYFLARRHAAELTGMAFHPKAVGEPGVGCSWLSFYGHKDYSILEIGSVRIAYPGQPTVADMASFIPVAQNGSGRTGSFASFQVSGSQILDYEFEGSKARGVLYDLRFSVENGVLELHGRRLEIEGRERLVVLSESGDLLLVTTPPGV